MAKIIIKSILIVLFVSGQAYSQGGFIAPFKIGNYYEYLYEESAISARYSAKITKDTIVNGKKIYTMSIYNEPPMGDYQKNFIFDTVSLNLYSPGGFCPDSTGFNLLGGFNLSEGYYWDTCRTGVYFRSSIIDTGTSTGIFNSGISLKYFTRKDTSGFIEITAYSSFAQKFGDVSYYSTGGSAFSGGPYGKTLVGAIIDGVRYGSIVLDVNQISNEVPSGFMLKQNFPNPFNPSTVIQFAIPKKQSVKISVFNSLGQQINVLVNEIKDAGTYQYIFNGKNLTSGIYFYRIETKDFTETKRMVLVK